MRVCVLPQLEYEWRHLPAGVAGLDAGLAEVDGDALALRHEGAQTSAAARRAVAWRAALRGA